MGLNKRVPDPWVINGMAGADWMTAFLKRNSTISLRSPEATSLSRATSFNKVNVANFFNKLESLYAREQFTPNRIWNIDETGCTTVQKPTKIVAATGIKQVGAIVSAEGGQLVTVCCAVSATGNSVPLMFVFPKVNYRDHFVNGAPTGSTGTAHPSGWMTSEGFLTLTLTQTCQHTRDQKWSMPWRVECLVWAKSIGMRMMALTPPPPLEVVGASTCRASDVWCVICMSGNSISFWHKMCLLLCSSSAISCDQLRPFLNKNATRMRCPVSVEKRLEITLWRIATNVEYRSITNMFGIRRRMEGKVVLKVSKPISEHLAPKFIRISHGDEFCDVVRLFDTKSGFPQCFGAID